MKLTTFLLLIVISCGCTSCGQRHNGESDSLSAQIVYHPHDCDTLLRCIQAEQNLSFKMFKQAFAQAEDRVKVDKSDEATLRFICLSLHARANSMQFRLGMQKLTQYIQTHPDMAPGLSGLQYLMQRINKERISGWSKNTKTSMENKGLMERNEQLELESEQNQARIQELLNQIDQLKNIENIIKNRER